MASRSVTTLALYCPKCGKIEMHELTRFSLREGKSVELVCGCGQSVATVTATSHRQYLLNVPCVLCNTCHRICLESRYFWGADAGKLYCAEENLELGFIGPREKIENTLENFRHEVEALIAERGGGETMEASQILFEALNAVHDIAEQGGLRCLCGNTAITADVLSGCIALRCLHCGASYTVPAESDEDLSRLKTIGRITLESGYCSHGK